MSLEKTMVINVDNVKTIKIASEIRDMLIVPASDSLMKKSYEAYKKYLGSKSIVDNVVMSGIIPKGLTYKQDDSGVKHYFYQDPYGDLKEIVDVYSFFNDIVAEASDFGFTPEQMAVAFAYGFGYTGDVLGSSREEMKKVQLQAYNEFQSQRMKGVHR